MIDKTLLEQLQTLYDPFMPMETILSNQIAALYLCDARISWAGIYSVSAVDECAWLFMFQGKPACARIRFNHGVIGACIEKQQTIVVDDVHKFPGHIACDPASRSELVIPLYYQGILAAVLDLDSDQKNHFAALDPETIHSLQKIFEKTLALPPLSLHPELLKD